MKTTGILWLVLFAAARCCFADLDEKGFQGYKEGELLGQNDWLPQGPDGTGSYASKEGLAEIRRAPAKNEQWIVWKSGFEGKTQTRLIKSFPETGGSKALVKLDFQPGASYVNGQLVFDNGTTGGEALRFVDETLRVANLDKPAGVDSKAPFTPRDWNHLELQFDFTAHTVQILVNGANAGSFPLSPSLDGIARVNFFAGGVTFESAMKNLSIQSVDSFPTPVK